MSDDPAAEINQGYEENKKGEEQKNQGEEQKNHSDGQNNQAEEYPPQLPANPPPYHRYLDFYRVMTDGMNNPIIPPVIIYSATDNPWNIPLMRGLLDFDYIPENHGLLPRLRAPPPCPQIILPPNLFKHPQPHRPVYLMGEYPPLPLFRMGFHRPPLQQSVAPPIYHIPPPICYVPALLPYVQHPEPPLPPLDRDNNDAVSSTESN